MKFKKYLKEKEIRSNISFCDIDDTLLWTYAKILVKNKKTGKIVKELTNSEFNSYKLKDDEEFNFDQFKDAKFFRETSKPIKNMVDRIKKMLNNIKEKSYNSKIILLTARSDFDDKDEFLRTFKDLGIDVNLKNFYVERTGNDSTGTVESRKEKTILKYLKTGNYRIVRMFDDHEGNLKTFMTLSGKIDNDILQMVKKKFEIKDGKPIMKFIALQALPNGKLRKYDEKDVYL